MPDCGDMYRQRHAFPVEMDGKVAFRDQTVVSRPVTYDGQDRVRSAGLAPYSAEPLVNLGTPVEHVDPCTGESRVAVAALTKIEPCNALCFGCDQDNDPINLRTDLPVATRIRITVYDSESGPEGVAFDLYACDPKVDCNPDSRECAGWAGFGPDDCHTCPKEWPGQPIGGQIAAWKGATHVHCTPCMAGSQDIVYSANVQILCHKDEEADPCELYYYLYVTLYIAPRLYGGCPPVYNCLVDTHDGPNCYDPPQPPPVIDRCSYYMACIQLNKLEQICGAFDQNLTLKCRGTGEASDPCDNTCEVLVNVTGLLGHEPYCRPCFDLEIAGPCAATDAVNPRQDVPVANALKVKLDYDLADPPNHCCNQLIGFAEMIATACPEGPPGCGAGESCKGCDPIPLDTADLIARWKSDHEAYQLVGYDICDEMLLLCSSQVEIYCWIPSSGDVVAPCYGLKVNVCLLVDTAPAEQCCGPTPSGPHCRTYSGCVPLQSVEQCGGSGRFLTGNGLRVPLHCAESPDCACDPIYAWLSWVS